MKGSTANGQTHEPSASLGAVPIMMAAAGIGLLSSVLFLRGVDDRGVPPVARPIE